MKAIFYKIKNEETGAAQIIEMTLIFPVVLLVMGFLIYMGNYVLQGVIMYNDAQRIAIAASREAGIPGYSELYEGTGVTTTADFNWPDNSAPSLKLVNKVMSEHNPYRYFGNSFLEESEKTTLEQNLESLVMNNSFLSASNVDCTITTSNNILNQQVKVRVIKYISPPDFLENLGIIDDLNIDITATAVVGDPAEFVRNTDMVFDLTEYMFTNLKIGKNNQTISEKIAIYKQKFSDIRAKLGLEW